MVLNMKVTKIFGNVIVLGILIILVFSLQTSAQSFEIKAPYTPHSPIRINSNADFAAQGFSGSGTQSDPYTIDLISIDASDAGCGIYIGNTTSYFLINNSEVKNTSGNSNQYFWNSGIVLYNVTHGTISNMKIFNGSEYGIYAVNSKWINISGGTFNYNYYGGIYLENSKNIEISAIHIYNQDTGSGLYLKNATTLWIHDNEINDTYNGIYGEPNTGMKNSIIENNIFRNNRGDGIALYATSDNNIIKGNNIYENNAKGVEMESTSNNTLQGNHIYSNGQDGIYLKNSVSKLIDNEIYENTLNGVLFNPATNCVVEDNKIYDNKNTGIYINTDSSSNRITHNNIWNNSAVGIDVISSSGNIVENNFIFNHTNVGIVLKSSSNSYIMNNTIYHSKNVDIEIYQDTSPNFVINNTVFDSNDGILVMYTQNAKVSWNHGYGNNQSIYVIGSDYNMIDNNTCENNTFNGIIIKGDNNTVENNTVRNNADGVYILGGLNNTVKYNVAVNNSDGILLRHTNYTTIFFNTLEGNHVGMYLNGSYYNVIYRNDFINNAQWQAYDDGNNTWNLSKPIGGNYWSDYTGSDNDGDGFGDTPYAIPGGNNQDYLPLTNPAIPEFPLFMPVVILLLGLVFIRKSRKNN